ncbi:S-layer homology domain-containing protein [Paenibacillus oryzisoli]|uniref:S-layer homology domain-containing protein n=1 Tax=Paenibacillus oryzisoli TaxID=1850517 RepID=UPI003D2B44B5
MRNGGSRLWKPVIGIKKMMCLLLMCALVAGYWPAWPKAVAEDAVPVPTNAVVITEQTTGGFTHPGVGLTKKILDDMREEVVAHKEPWYSYYVAMTQSSYASRTFTSSNQTDASDPTKPRSLDFNSQSYNSRFIADGLRAYTQALMYYITGDQVYRYNAMRIIRTWSRLDPAQYQYFTDAHIHTGIPLNRMVTAAEILRYSTSEGEDPELQWTEADTSSFTANLITPVIETFQHSNGYFMNQHLYPLLGAMSGYIFTDNLTRYNEGVEWFTVNKDAVDQGQNGSIKQLFRLVSTDITSGEAVVPPRVQHVEMGRDQAHGAGDLTNVEILGRLLEAQGTKVDPVEGTVSTAQNAVSIYSFLDKRILKAADYFAQFMLGYDTPWTPVAAHTDAAGNPTVIYKILSGAYRGRIGGNVYGQYYYYKYKLGLDLEQEAPYYADMFKKRTPYYWESPDGGADYWLFIPKEAEAEGASTFPKVSASADWAEIENRSTSLDSHSAIKQEGETSYVEVTATEAGSRVSVVASSTALKKVALKIRTNGPAKLEINGWTDDTLVLPDTKGQWTYVTYTLNSYRGLGDLIYFKIIGSGTVVDLDHLLLGPAAQVTPPVFSTGKAALTLYGYVGSQAALDYDFSASDAEAGDTVTYQIDNRPAGAVFDEQTGVFSWKPDQEGTYTFVVSATDGTSVSAKEVTVTVASSRQGAVNAAIASYSPATSYISASLEAYEAKYEEALQALSTASDEDFYQELADLNSAVQGLQLLTPLMADGSMDYMKMGVTSTFATEIAKLADGAPDSFAGYYLADNLGYVVDFGADYKVSASAFEFQVRAGFPERIGGAAVFGSNDGETWTRLTPGLTKRSDDLQPLAVSDAFKQTPYRFLKIQMLESEVGMFEMSEMRIYGTRHEANNKLVSVSLSSPQSVQNRVGAGDTVALSFTSSEPIQDVQILIQGQPAALSSVDQMHWTTSITLSNLMPTGKIKFAIDYKTAKGLTADTVIFSTDNSVLYYVDSTKYLDIAKLAAVTASSAQYGSGGLPADKVGYLLFDGNTSTYGDLASGTGAYYTVDFGPDATVRLSDVILMPRSGYAGRMNGVVVQGSNDNEHWSGLTPSVSGSADNTWSYISGDQIKDNSAYRYLRIYNSTAWSGNLAELELYGVYDIQRIDSKVVGPEGYTRLSYDQYRQEVDRIQAAIGLPGADKLALLQALFAAEKRLVPVTTLPADPIPITASMVTASSTLYGNSGVSKEANGWRAFDGDINTYTDTSAAAGWIVTDLGANNEKSLVSFKFYPRNSSKASEYTRVNGAILQGSNDGENYTNLYTISGVNAVQWYTAPLANSAAYRYLRYYSPAGYANVAELQFYQTPVDKTLLAYLLEQAEGVAPDLYTLESVQTFNQAQADAAALNSSATATQAQVDAAASALQAALNGFAYLPGVPVLAPIGDRALDAESALSVTIQTVNSVTGTVYAAEQLPAGAVFDPNTHTLSWMPSREQGGVYTIRFTATAGGFSTSKTLKLTVRGVPQIAPGSSLVLTAGQQAAYQVVASDPSGTKLIYSVSGLPTAASVNAGTGSFVWTPGQADYGDYTAIFSVSNGKFTANQTVTVHVDLKVLAPVAYTKGSYYLYTKEVERIRAAMGKNGANKAALAAELDQAEKKLVPLMSLPAEKIVPDPSGVIASTVVYGNAGTAEANGWRALDGNVGTFTDTTANPSWITVDLGAGHETSLGSFKYYPRSGFATRVNGAIVQGSVDGSAFTNLYTLSGAVDVKWYQAPIDDAGVYRYLRYYAPSGNANVAELEFYKKPIDRTLLDVLLAQADGLNEEAYEEAGFSGVVAARAAARTVAEDAASTQAQMDEAADSLLHALDQLVAKAIIVSLDAVEVGTVVSIPPDLPTVVNAVYNTQEVVPVPVVWTAIDPVQYSIAGHFSVTGAVYGTAIPAMANVTVVDPDAPLLPTQLHASSITTTSLILNWTGATDNVGVTGYDVFLDGQLAGTVTGNTYSYSFTGLAPDTSYTFKVVAFDGSGNRTPSADYTVRTAAIQQSEVPSGGTSTTTTTAFNGVKEPVVTGSRIQVTPVVKDGAAQTSLSAETMREAIENAVQDRKKTLVLDLQSEDERPSSIFLEIPADSWRNAQTAGVKSIAVQWGQITLTFSSDAMPDLSDRSKVALTIGPVDSSEVPVALSQTLKDKPVYEFTLTADGQRIGSFQGNNAVEVRIPYTRQTGESPLSLVAAYLNEQGRLDIVRNSKYDAAEGMLVFYAKHFSKYAVISNPVTFTDLASHTWAQSSVNALASRQIVNGVDDHRFAPERAITRAEFLTLLMQAYDLVKTGYTASFTDVTNGQWYSDAVATAQAMQIVAGYEDGSFGLERQISREEMVVMAVRIVKAPGIELSHTHPAVSFKDAAEIADYAATAVKTLSESGFLEGQGAGNFAPKSSASRAEAAVLIARMLGLN